MKISKRVLELFCFISLGLVGGLVHASIPYIVTNVNGELITIEPEPVADSTDAETASAVSPSHEPIDLSNATLTISHEKTNTEGDQETVTLFEGPFHENFSEEVSVAWKPTEVTITLQITEDSDPMTINTVIGTSDIHLALIDRPGPRDVFWLVGSTDQVLNQENKFSITGDLSFLDIDLINTTAVEVYAIVYDEDGNPQGKQWGPVLVENNKFHIEGEVDQPITATLFTHAGHNSQTTVVLEPQSELKVGKLGNQTMELSTTSGTGYHAMLVESWQQSEEYIGLIEAYATEYDQYLKRWEAGEPEPVVSDDKHTNRAEDETDVAENETDVAEVETDTTNSEETAEKLSPVEGCEDAVAKESNTNPQSSSAGPRFYSLHAKARNYRNEKLKEIAEGDGDPMLRYLAINMHPFHWRDYASPLAVLQSLVTELEDDFVATFITPKIEDYGRAIVLVQNDEQLIPGQKVPGFVLSNYDGKEVELYELLGENDLVLIDFWASWCGPCIADFPELKKLHAAYTDEDFEIVGVSIDSTVEDWKGSVVEHELPWINLGEIKGWEGPVSTMYGVDGIPKGFLVDSQGCIYKKNIRPAALKEFLVDRYGLHESLVEPEEETDDPPDVSS